MSEASNLWLKSARELLNKPPGSGTHLVSFATSMLTALYGPQSTQFAQFQTACAAIQHKASDTISMTHYLRENSEGVIRNTMMELEAGLLGRVRVAVAGEILEELVRLAKEVMVDRTEEAKNAGAVLIAAAYEGLLRRMGEEFAGVKNRPKLDEIITALKNASVFKGGQVGIAQSYLKFRNDSLHADWKNVDRSQVDSCIAFTESLLVKHFS